MVCEAVKVKIEIIEERALRLGWHKDQLYKESPRYDEKGLIHMLSKDQFIEKVTEKAIHLIKFQGGHIVRTKFYNMRTSQPWIRKVKKKRSL